MPSLVFSITHEVFDDYLLYLQRTKSERIEKEKVQNKLPDTLQKAVLEYVQFRTTRLDATVDSVYSYFVDRYVIDEHVDCILNNRKTHNAVIREVPPLEEQTSDDVKYKIQLVDQNSKPIKNGIKTVRRSDIKRDRFGFSKNLLKKFLREATVKDTYIGAPWVVNNVFAERFDINTTLPKDLEAARQLAYSKSRKMRAIAAAERRKELENNIKEAEDASQKNKVEDARKIELLLKYPMEDLDLPAYRRVEKGNEIPTLLDMTPGTGNEELKVPNPTGDLPMRPAPSHCTISSDCYGLFLMVWSFLNVFSKPLNLSPFNLDDFEAALRHSSVDPKYELVYEVLVSLLNCLIRHRLKHGNQNLTLLPASIGDDDNGSPRTPLLASHLGPSIVNDNSSQVNTPGSNSNSSGSEMDSDSDYNNENDDEENGNKNRKGQSKWKNQPNNKKTSSNGIENRVHGYLERGCGSAEVVKIGNNWDSKIIPPGNERYGWEDVLIGAINDLTIEFDENVATFDSILCSLIPHLDSTLKERQEAYILLNLKDKLRILQLLVHAVNETSDIKEYMEECQEQLTELRKQKIELNRERKRIQAERNEVEKRYEGLDNNNQSESEEPDDENDDEDQSDNEDKSASRNEDDSLNRHESRQAILKRKQQEREEREAKRKKLFHHQRQVARERNQELKVRASARKKLDDEERAIQRKCDQVDKDMRKYSTLRFKPLGRDRFYNRYYYLDNIGSGYSHGSGKLFVQSPSTADLLMLLERDRPETYQSDNKNEINTLNSNKSNGVLTTSATVNSPVTSQDKKSSSSSTLSCGHGGGLKFVCQLMEHQGLADKATLLKEKIHDMINGTDYEWWEAFDDPDTLNELLEWLNPKGNREHLLKKELQKHVSILLTGMKKHSNERQLLSTETARRSTRTRATIHHPTGSWYSYTNKLAK
ncbi:unnamed protein product [Cunninghamella echinulata]